MALSTDLSRSPYYDDYSADKNFYRVLYRPGTAVQTRELNQMQTILQDQIDKFGRHIFTEGSVVEGCSFTFDNNYEYVKINDTYANGYAFTISDFQDKYVYNSNGLKGIIVNTVVGYSSQDPDLNTIYLKYLNVGTFSNGSPQSTFANNDSITISSNSEFSNTTAIVGSVSVASVANSTGKGYAFTTTQGVIFQKGFFVNVRPQTLIVSKYNNTPTDISVGFNSVENIITPESDISLLDNAAGAPNYAAPGAHRLQLNPTLYTTSTSALTNEFSFFSLVDFVDGVPISIRNTPEYNILGRQLAQRTYETNGNFIVSPFLLSTEGRPTDDSKYHDYVNLVVSRGLGYVEGYRVEFVNNVKTLLRKGIDTETISNQTVSANYGNYVYISEYCGDFDTENLAVVELHNVAKTSISSLTFLSSGYSSSTKIGTAKVKAVVYDSGAIGTKSALYRIYLYDVIMSSGYNFSDAKSIIRYNSTLKAVADVYLTYNATLNANVAILQETSLNSLVFPLGQQAIKSDGFSNIQYVYRNQSSAQILNNGNTSVSLPNVIVGSGTESFIYSGSLNNQEIESFIIIPTANGSCNVGYTGTASATSGTKIVTGVSTVFDQKFQSGDFIKVNNELHIVNSVANSTSLTVNENFVASATNVIYSKAFIAGVPIDYTRNGSSISVNGSTAYFSLGEPLTVGTTLQTVIYYDIQRNNTVAIKKNITKNALVKIDCSTHAANSTGPWSLGLPDVFKINSIYIGSSGIYGNSSTSADILSSFNFRNGQGDNIYNLGSISLKNNVLNLLDNNSTLLVDLDVFSQDRSQGVGFFTANSYPVDDYNVANTIAITTSEIPKYTASSSYVYDLRDCVDFRPYMSNTANITQTLVSATINPSNTSSSVNLLASGSYIPSINTNWQSNVEHYLPRKDLAVITTKGQVKIIEGISDIRPIQPRPISGAMTLGVINIPPYPSLTPSQAKMVNRYDYSITSSITQNKRYTMADIGTLSIRINNLEYYSSLNLLEQSTNALLVKNDTTGLNRFKNGILVDPFAGHDIGDTLDPNYNIAIDPVAKELRPRFSQRIESFDLDTELSTGVIRKNSTIMLDYTETQYISQNYASKYRNCIEGNIYVWKTNVELSPNYQTSPSLKDPVDVLSDLDLSANWINLQKAWGTQWGNWQTINTSTTTPVVNKTLNSSTTDSAGNITKTYTERTTTTTSTDQTRTGYELDIKSNTSKVPIGTFVTDVGILPFIQTATIKFKSFGLKPNSRVYAYFNNINVTNFCFTTDRYYTITPTTQYSKPLYVNSDGSIFGWFTIPPNTFQATELTFMLCDVNNLVTGSNAITTQGIGIYYANKLSIAKGNAILNVKEPIVQIHEVYSDQTLTNTNNVDKTTTEIQPGPPIVIPPPVINPGILPGYNYNNPSPSQDGYGDNYSYYPDGGGGEDDDCSCDE